MHGNGNAHSANPRVCEPRPYRIDENSIDEQTVFNSSALRCHHGDQLQRTGNLRCRSRPFDCSLLSSLPLRNEVRRSIHEFKMNSMATLPRLQLFGSQQKNSHVAPRLPTRGSILKLPPIVLKLPPIKETVGIFNKVEMCPEVRDQNLQYGAYYTSKSHNT